MTKRENATYFRAGDVIRVAETGEPVKVTAVSSNSWSYAWNRVKGCYEVTMESWLRNGGT